MYPEISETALAATLDHAILAPSLTRTEVDAELETAALWRVFSVCVRPCDVAHASTRLTSSDLVVGTVIGFPHGTTSTVAKVAEARRAIDDGAHELDIVVNIGWLRSGLHHEVFDDIAAVIQTSGALTTKVILETALLDDGQIRRGCQLAEAAGAAFVKTSTGFARGGASVAHVELMRASVGQDVQVKASGGVRGLDTARQMLRAGATRLGTSASAIILGELRSGRHAPHTSAQIAESPY